MSGRGSPEGQRQVNDSLESVDIPGYTVALGDGDQPTVAVPRLRQPRATPAQQPATAPVASIPEGTADDGELSYDDILESNASQSGAATATAGKHAAPAGAPGQEAAQTQSEISPEREGEVTQQAYCLRNRRHPSDEMQEALLPAVQQLQATTSEEEQPAAADEPQPPQQQPQPPQAAGQPSAQSPAQQVRSSLSALPPPLRSSLAALPQPRLSASLSALPRAPPTVKPQAPEAAAAAAAAGAAAAAAPSGAAPAPFVNDFSFAVPSPAEHALPPSVLLLEPGSPLSPLSPGGTPRVEISVPGQAFFAGQRAGSGKEAEGGKPQWPGTGKVQPEPPEAPEEPSLEELEVLAQQRRKRLRLILAVVMVLALAGLSIVMWQVVALRSRRAAEAASAKSWCPDKPPKYLSPPAGQPPPPLIFKDGRFVAADSGEEVALHGFNYFGFNNNMTAPDGLWAPGPSAVADLSTIMYQMSLLGFNMVRLPFKFTDMELEPRSFDKACETSSATALRARVTDPRVAPRLPASAVLPEPLAWAGSSAAGRCNDYLPASSVLDRYLWAVEYFVSSGFYVMVDYHPHLAEPQVVYDRATFVLGWSNMWKALSCSPRWPSLTGRLLLDLLNEPDELGMAWEAKAAKPALADMLLAAMDELWRLSPGEPLMLVQGAGQLAMKLNWGDGTVTDTALIKNYSLSNPNPFFTKLMAKPYRRAVALTPHLYPPSVTGLPAFTPQEHVARLERSIGHLQQPGYCLPGGDCQKFPVVIGEIGSKFIDPRDTVYYDRLAAWLTGRQISVAQPSWTYWCYNANSGDTGGLVSDDWQSLQWGKLGYLVDKWGLRPWYTTYVAA